MGEYVNACLSLSLVMQSGISTCRLTTSVRPHPMASSSTNVAAPATTDPFQFLSRHLQRRVAVHLLPRDPADAYDGGTTVTGTLLSVDDLGNVMVSNWSSTDDIRGVDVKLQPQRKKARADFGSGEEESLRLIRGAQIAAISFLE